MTFSEAFVERSVDHVRRRVWPAEMAIDEWEEHLWVFVNGNRLAPWCPQPDDMSANDWEAPQL